MPWCGVYLNFLTKIFAFIFVSVLGWYFLRYISLEVHAGNMKIKIIAIKICLYFID